MEKHLSLDDRKRLKKELKNGLRKFEIAKSINRSPSTITKEIKKNRKLKPRNLYNVCVDIPIAIPKYKIIISAIISNIF